MNETELLDQLAAHRTLGSAPREELEWLAANGTLRHLNTGDVLSAKNDRVEGMYIVLSGHISIFVDRGAGFRR
jgi:signal-transduction protein with cAMP-binding, CBS, and nucleotidyltransferase domain